MSNKVFSVLIQLTNTPNAIHLLPIFSIELFQGLIDACSRLICPSIHFKRSRQSRICPSSPGRIPLSTPRCSRRSVSLSISRSLQAPLRVNSPFRSWSCGSSTWTRPQEEAFMSTASPRRGHGNPLDVPVDAAPPRYHRQVSPISLNFSGLL